MNTQVDPRQVDTPQIDPRGLRFTATVTAVLLAAVLATAPSALAIALLAAQTLLFGWGVLLGAHSTPLAWVFRTFVRPRLAAPTELEDATPPRFAQGVGLAFAVVGLVGFLLGAPIVGLIAVGFALAAAVLNAAFGFCLGCELYLLLKRVTGSRVGSAGVSTGVSTGLSTTEPQPVRTSV